MASVIHPSSQEENLQCEDTRVPFGQYSSENLYRSTVDCKQALRRAKKSRRYHSISEGTTSRTFMSSISNIIEELDEADAVDAIRLNSGNLPCGKNSRKSRNGFRCRPKKSGFGGRSMPLKLGLEVANLMLEDLDFDTHDPIYDSDEDDNVRLVRSQPKGKSFEEEVEEFLKEFYEHGQVEEVMIVLEEGNFTAKQCAMLPYLAITLAMQRRPQHCEMTSRLLAATTGKVLSHVDVENAFDNILNELADLSLDVPTAPDILGRFIARAVADDVLPPKYVQSYKGRLTCSFAVRAMSQAENLLLMNHAYTRLDNVWGMGGAHMPTKLLLKRVKLLLEEYVSSNDKDEATMCVRELDVPHYHHELVYQAVLMVLEKGSAEVCRRIGSVLQYWSDAVIVTVNQLTMGMRRIYEDLADISLDVPNAYALLEHFVMRNKHFMPSELLRDIPSAPRKRFVSEGNPTLFKETSLHQH